MAAIKQHLRQRKKRQTDVLRAADFYIPTLPGLPADSTLSLFGGHIPTSPPNVSPPSDAHLFFLLARNRHIADRERLIIWVRTMLPLRAELVMHISNYR